MGEGRGDGDVFVDFLIQRRGERSRVVDEGRLCRLLFDRRDAIADIERQADERDRHRKRQKSKVMADRMRTSLSCRHCRRPLCGSVCALNGTIPGKPNSQLGTQQDTKQPYGQEACPSGRHRWRGVGIDWTDLKSALSISKPQCPYARANPKLTLGQVKRFLTTG